MRTRCECWHRGENRDWLPARVEARVLASGSVYPARRSPTSFTPPQPGSMSSSTPPARKPLTQWSPNTMNGIEAIIDERIDIKDRNINGNNKKMADTLSRIETTLNQLTAQFTQLSASNAQNTTTLNQHTEILNQLSATLTRHEQMHAQHTTLLTENTAQLESLEQFDQTIAGSVRDLNVRLREVEVAVDRLKGMLGLGVRNACSRHVVTRFPRARYRLRWNPAAAAAASVSTPDEVCSGRVCRRLTQPRAKGPGLYGLASPTPPGASHPPEATARLTTVSTTVTSVQSVRGLPREPSEPRVLRRYGKVEALRRGEYDACHRVAAVSVRGRQGKTR